MNYLTVFQTSDLLEQFENAIERPLSESDAFELFNQLFDLLDHHSPPDLIDRRILTFDRFIFPNHLTVSRDDLDVVAYAILAQLHQRLIAEKFYVDNQLMFFPSVMVEKDLAVRRYNS